MVTVYTQGAFLNLINVRFYCKRKKMEKCAIIKGMGVGARGFMANVMFFLIIFGLLLCGATFISDGIFLARRFDADGDVEEAFR